MTQPAQLFVGPLDAVDQVIAKHDISHIISLINREMMIPTPSGISPENHLRLSMNDIAQPVDGFVLPSPDHVASLLDFAMAWQGRSPMLVHCWAGISRSTAAAFIILCALNPSVPELDIARRLRSASDTASPNPLLVRHADDLLGREGRMVAAVQAIGRGRLAMSGSLFSLPAFL